MIDLVPDDFERHVRDCLAHFYDFTVIQTSPLASRIAPELTGLQRVQTVRRILIDTVEQLKARETAGIPSRQERVYSLLLMRYIEGLPIQVVLRQLALSERQFYREDRRAIQTLSQLLWDNLRTSQPMENAISVKSEIQRLSRQTPYISVDVEALLSEVIVANANLADDHRVTIHLRPGRTLRELNAHEAVLRPTIIWMLSQTIIHVAEGSHVILSAATIGDIPAITFEISDPSTSIQTLQEILTNNPTGAELLATLKGTITITEADRGSYLVQFQLQHQRPVILVIDDNPDAVALLERYVAGTTYELVSAYGADEGFRLAQNMEPACIVLDILLPNTDGWKTLQELRSNPRTQPIPVLICSALDNPDLALSLGADAYLRKPPDRISFIEALTRWTAPKH